MSTVLLQAMVGNEDLNCFDIYHIEVASATQSVTQGPFIPLVTAGVNAQELTVAVGLESELIKDNVYSVNIISISVNGQANSTGTIQFSKFTNKECVK